ncbi:endonuclease 8-like 2 [Xenopus tropicalis]|uniref:Endonuclease 8-like 2 n=1 Tax=Xenopus tropicalis TaxID=8364 RepID=A9ULI4_XENTR|nr:endonuclease 8-like 2 [Xenopus tropicalis]AAI57270.1 LOC100135209 protein [Xenopus tropicalis]|eukprot:NP_001107382.1 endonuclease 8-like 2 [Xenopus tropicalis]
MPEGPTVRRFCSLVSPFVGQNVVKVGGSTKKIALQDLQGKQFHYCQVHGKNLYLEFTTKAVGNILSGTEDAKEHIDQAGGSQKDYSIIQPTSEEHSESLQDADYSEIHMSRWLRFHFGLYGSVRSNEFARAKQANKRGDWRDPTPRLILNFESGGFLVFYNCRMAWCSSPASKPNCDVLSPEFDTEQAVRALSASQPVCFTLMDQKCFSGVGNIIKNEILFLEQVHPLCLGSLLPIEKLHSLVSHTLHFTSDWLSSKMKKEALHYHIYMKEYCDKGHKVIKEKLGPPYGIKRLTYFCPVCQPQVKCDPSSSSL